MIGLGCFDITIRLIYRVYIGSDQNEWKDKKNEWGRMCDCLFTEDHTVECCTIVDFYVRVVKVKVLQLLVSMCIGPLVWIFLIEMKYEKNQM